MGTGERISACVRANTRKNWTSVAHALTQLQLSEQYCPRLSCMFFLARTFVFSHAVPAIWRLRVGFGPSQGATCTRLLIPFANGRDVRRSRHPPAVDAGQKREGQGAAACQRRQSVQPVSVGSRCSLSVPKGCLDRGCDGERLRRCAALSFCITAPCRLSPGRGLHAFPVFV